MTAPTSEAPAPLLSEAIVIGGGPAGLMAAEVLSRAGVAVDLFDAMPSVGRKFLLAGKGGMNLTHAEPFDAFADRYGERSAVLRPWLEAFGPAQVRDWAASLGIDTFVGSSQRVFPTDMKAAPLLRAWLQRLRHPGNGGVPVRFHMRHRCLGPTPQTGGAAGTTAWRFDTPQGPCTVQARATVLALGGGSWARLGSDGAWQGWLSTAAGAQAVAPLVPANCGFDVQGSPVHGVAAGWSPFFRDRFAGQPFKSVAIRFEGDHGPSFHRKGEFVATATGVEGSLIYAVSSALREQIARSGRATFWLDLLPDRSPEQVRAQVAHPRGARSVSAHLKSRLGIDGIKMALLNELLTREQLHDPQALASAIQALPVTVVGPRPIDEAISSAGGVRFESMDEHGMLTGLPGCFCAGEMLDWEAPTGGYLLTACLASGQRAGQGAWQYLCG